MKKLTIISAIVLAAIFGGCGPSDSGSGSGKASPGTGAVLDTSATPEGTSQPAKADTNKTDTIK